jgi:hypothetical protein
MPETTKVASNDGKLIEVSNLVVDTSKIYNFVERYRKDYFEDHSLDWSLDEILSRGMAEITRQVKTARKRAEDSAAGTLLKQYNMSPAEAAKILATLKAQSEAASKDASKK